MFKSIGVKLDSFRDDLALRYAAKYMPESKLGFQGIVTCEHFRDGKMIHTQTGKNIFTAEGINHMLNVVFVATARDAVMYVGIFKGNVTPADGDTSAVKLGSGGGYTACQDADYDSPATNHATYTGVVSSKSCTNTASKATFVIAGSITVYGAYLTNNQAKTATAGKLICAKLFTSSRAVIADDELAITYVINVTSS
jgi:hypothetical protein